MKGNNKVAIFFVVASALLSLNSPSYSQVANIEENQSSSQLSLPAFMDANTSNFENVAIGDEISYAVGSTLLSASSNVPYVYKKGDWKKPTKYKKSYARRAKYGDGVTIGIMDTAINCGHKNLKTYSKRTCKSWYYGASNPTFDTEAGWGHGSNAAGVAAGTGGYGVAYRSNIEGFAVFDDNGWYLTSDQYLSAVDYLVNTRKAKILNWSFGVPYQPGSTFKPLTSVDISAIRIAKNKALVVKSAGNGYEGKGKYYNTTWIGNTKKNVLSSYLNNFIMVGALDAKGKKIAKWSDRPGEGCFQGLLEFKCTKRNKYKYYFIVAPGYVRTTAGSGNGSTKTQGTSFSAPIVAGAAALIQSRWPKLKPQQIRNILLKTATDMGKKGVDKVYGRGALNISKALKPIKGKVGGVRVKSNNAIVFNRLASVGEFSSDIKVIDAFGRDFDAVGYAYENQAFINTFDILPSGEFSIHVNQSAMSQDELSFEISGFSVGGLSYFSEVLGNTGHLSFERDDGLLGGLPTSLVSLNAGNQAALFYDDDISIFAFMPNKKNSSMLETNTIGIKKLWTVNDKLTINSTAAFMKERGFHGLSSVEGFGFENKNQSVFFQVGLSHSSRFGSFDAGLSHHRSNGSYSSDNIRWNSLGVSQIQAGVSKTIGDTRIGIKAMSGLNLAGTLKSSMKGLETVDDYYHQQSKIAVNLNKKINDRSNLDLNLTTERHGAFDVSYSFKF